MSSTQLQKASSTAVAPRDIDDVFKIASAVAKSGLYGLRDPNQAYVIIAMGVEMGLTPMQSLRGIYCISGKPVLSADLIVALVRNSGLAAFFEVEQADAKGCTYVTRRADSDREHRFTFKLEDAQRAGLLGNNTWKKYPDRMCRARAAVALARQEYPEVCLGLYTADELSDGKVGDVEPPQSGAIELDVEPLVSESDAKNAILDTIKENLGLNEVDAVDRARRICAESALTFPIAESRLDEVLANICAPSQDSDAPVDLDASNEVAGAEEHGEGGDQ